MKIKDKFCAVLFMLSMLGFMVSPIIMAYFGKWVIAGVAVFSVICGFISVYLHMD